MNVRVVGSIKWKAYNGDRQVHHALGGDRNQVQQVSFKRWTDFKEHHLIKRIMSYAIV